MYVLMKLYSESQFPERTVNIRRLENKFNKDIFSVPDGIKKSSAMHSSWYYT